MSSIFQKPPQNYQYIAGIANIVDFKSTPVTQVGVVVNGPLQDLVIPARTFVQDGQKLIVNGYGLLTTPISIGQISVAIDGTSIAIVNSAISGTQFAWKYDLELIRQGVDLLIFVYSQIGIAISAGSTFSTNPTNTSFTTFPSFDFNVNRTILFRATLNNVAHTVTQLFSWASIH